MCKRTRTHALQFAAQRTLRNAPSRREKDGIANPGLGDITSGTRASFTILLEGSVELLDAPEASAVMQSRSQALSALTQPKRVR